MHIKAPVGKGIDIVISTAPPQPIEEPILWADNKPFMTFKSAMQRMDDPCYITLNDDESGYKMTAVFTRKEYEKFVKLLYQSVKRDKRNRKKEKKMFKKSQHKEESK